MLIKDLEEFIKGVGEQTYKTLVSTDGDRMYYLDMVIDCPPDFFDIDEYNSNMLRDEVIEKKYLKGMDCNMCRLSGNEGEHGRQRKGKRQHLDRKILEDN